MDVGSKWAIVDLKKRMVIISEDSVAPSWFWRTLHRALFGWIWVQYFTMNDLARMKKQLLDVEWT